MSLVRNIFNVSLATGASRVMGFVRDILVASTLGAGPVADAFVVAFRLPNLFRRLFAEGAFNSAFVPLYAKRVQDDEPHEAQTFAEDVLAVLVTAMGVFSVALMLAMPWVVLMLAPGFHDEPGKFALTVDYTRLCFPYLLCMCVLALLGGVLNSHRKFGFAAWAPVLLNTILSAALLLAGTLGYAGTPVAGYYLAAAVLVAGFAQVGMLAWVMARLNLRLRLKRPRLTPGVRRLFALAIPGLIAGGITQINLVIGTMIASTEDSAVSWLYYADRLYQFPLGMVGVTIGVILLPELARDIRAGDAKVLATQNRALELSMLLTLPAAVALGTLSTSIIAGLFERGAFQAQDTAMVSMILAVFACGLPAFVMTKVFSPAFFAREDTRRPMMVALLSSAVNVALSLLLFNPLGPAGIAAATVIAGWVDALGLFILLRRHRHFVADAPLLRRLGVITATSVAMGMGLMAIEPLALRYLGAAHGLLQNLLVLSAMCGGGLAFYALGVLVFGGVDRAAIAAFLRARRNRKAAGTVPPDLS